jgi:hypothetical protein
MDTNPNVEIRFIQEEDVDTDRLGLYAKNKLERGDTLGIPVMQVFMEKHVCLLSQHERTHLREATHSFKDLVVEAFCKAADQGLYCLSLDDRSKLDGMKMYVTGIYSPRKCDNAAATEEGKAASYMDEPNDNEPNAIFALALAQPVVLVDVEKGMPVYISYGCDEYYRTWPTRVDKCKDYELKMGSKELEQACRDAAQNKDVRAAILECLVCAVARTSKFHARSMMLLDMPFQEAKGHARDLWEELLKHLQPLSDAMKKRQSDATRVSVLEDKHSTPVELKLKVKVDVTNGIKRTVNEDRIIMSLPEGSTATLFNVHPVMRSVLARAVEKCKDDVHVAEAGELHKVRAVMVNEVRVSAFNSWNDQTGSKAEGRLKGLTQRIDMWLAKHLPPFVRIDKQTCKSVEVIRQALQTTGWTVIDGLAEGAETNAQVVVGLGVAMLAGFTVDTVLATLAFMNSRSGWESYVHDDYVHYAEEFLENETNEGLLVACKLKCDEMNERLNQKVPTPTLFGLHACNSLVVEGYLSMLYVTGTLGTASTLRTARAGYIIAKLVPLWLAQDDNGELLRPQKWKNWLKLKLRALEAGLKADGATYTWVTCTLLKNTEDIRDAHFFPGRGPPTYQDVKILNAELLERFWDVVKQGEGAGGYSLNDMGQHFKRASKRAGARSGQLQKAVIAFENAAEMVFDESQLHVSLDLVLKGINPTKANIEAEKKMLNSSLPWWGTQMRRKQAKCS